MTESSLVTAGDKGIWWNAGDWDLQIAEDNFSLEGESCKGSLTLQNIKTLGISCWNARNAWNFLLMTCGMSC